MSQSSMTCADERQLGSKLTKDLGYSNAHSSFEDTSSSPQKILENALADSQTKGGLDEVLTTALKGSAWWAYVVLRYGPDLGDRRDEFLSKATQHPKAAFHTLHFIPNLGSHRYALIARTMDDPGWASSTLRHIPDLGLHAEAALKAAIDTPPVENGGGWNTYFVNQSGIELWVAYDNGAGTITSHQLNPGQNVGWGRGGNMVSALRVWTSNPNPNNDQPNSGWDTQAGFLDSWQLPQGANGLKSWGFRINKTGIVETSQWYSGGMPDQYPPSNGNS